ncbi:hypothetical protein BKA83DRAFT_4491349 [Pisolithus microcarpus]|nr:hypothetical protein BKA83DRAFT_4491349 [Pisolithus microcarpus]
MPLLSRIGILNNDDFEPPEDVERRDVLVFTIQTRLYNSPPSHYSSLSDGQEHAQDVPLIKNRYLEQQRFRIPPSRYSGLLFTQSVMNPVVLSVIFSWVKKPLENDLVIRNMAGAQSNWYLEHCPLSQPIKVHASYQKLLECFVLGGLEGCTGGGMKPLSAEDCTPSQPALLSLHPSHLSLDPPLDNLIFFDSLPSNFDSGVPLHLNAHHDNLHKDPHPHPHVPQLPGHFPSSQLDQVHPPQVQYVHPPFTQVPGRDRKVNIVGV